ncbi:MAG: hypothetical protein A2629_01760 [Candidatus Levybacteria bacterium RIFCSPHIGHO2_01_FULL_41_15]|nr:MAG: hypothetical protein A2629_01760 [Candidatus Levybacteria bacterium RIFCSPHIGHO2_01_FULL_41_15]
MLNIEIRSYVPSDYPSVKKNLTEGGIYDENMDAEERLTEKIQRNPDSILVAVLDGQVVGNVLIMEDGWGPLLFRLAVGQSFREKGIGTKLLEEAENKLKDKGYKEVHILIGENESELQEYYAKRGYKEGNLYRWMYKEF